MTIATTPGGKILTRADAVLDGCTGRLFCGCTSYGNKAAIVSGLRAVITGVPDATVVQHASGDVCRDTVGGTTFCDDYLYEITRVLSTSEVNGTYAAAAYFGTSSTPIDAGTLTEIIAAATNQDDAASHCTAISQLDSIRWRFPTFAIPVTLDIDIEHIVDACVDPSAEMDSPSTQTINQTLNITPHHFTLAYPSAGIGDSGAFGVQWTGGTGPTGYGDALDVHPDTSPICYDQTLLSGKELGIKALSCSCSPLSVLEASASRGVETYSFESGTPGACPFDWSASIQWGALAANVRFEVDLHAW